MLEDCSMAYIRRVLRECGANDPGKIMLDPSATKYDLLLLCNENGIGPGVPDEWTMQMCRERLQLEAAGLAPKLSPGALVGHRSSRRPNYGGGSPMRGSPYGPPAAAPSFTCRRRVSETTRQFSQTRRFNKTRAAVPIEETGPRGVCCGFKTSPAAGLPAFTRARRGGERPRGAARRAAAIAKRRRAAPQHASGATGRIFTALEGRTCTSVGTAGVGRACSTSN